MELLLDPAPDATVVSLWKHPAAWLQEKNLGRSYWVFFSAAFFFDAGFSIDFSYSTCPCSITALMSGPYDG